MSGSTEASESCSSGPKEEVVSFPNSTVASASRSKGGELASLPGFTGVLLEHFWPVR